jgi:acetyl-CoA carboxylase alpha subunit
MAEVWRVLFRHLDQIRSIPPAELARARREKFRRIGAIEGRFPTS